MLRNYHPNSLLCVFARLYRKNEQNEKNGLAILLRIKDQSVKYAQVNERFSPAGTERQQYELQIELIFRSAPPLAAPKIQNTVSSKSEIGSVPGRVRISFGRIH